MAQQGPQCTFQASLARLEGGKATKPMFQKVGQLESSSSRSILPAFWVPALLFWAGQALENVLEHQVGRFQISFLLCRKLLCSSRAWMSETPGSSASRCKGR